MDTKKKPRVESLSKVRISRGNYNVAVFYFSIVDMFFIVLLFLFFWGGGGEGISWKAFDVLFIGLDL